MQNMPWKENTKPHLSGNIGSEQRGDRAERVRNGGGVGWGRRGDSGSAHCVETLQGQAAGCFHSPNSNSGPVQGRPAARHAAPCIRGACLSLAFREALAPDLSKGERSDGALAGMVLSQWAHASSAPQPPKGCAPERMSRTLPD